MMKLKCLVCLGSKKKNTSRTIYYVLVQVQGIAQKNCFGDVELCATNNSSFSPLLYLIDGATSMLIQNFFSPSNKTRQATTS